MPQFDLCTLTTIVITMITFYVFIFLIFNTTIIFSFLNAQKLFMKFAVATQISTHIANIEKRALLAFPFIAL